jgi:hypothetical protein
MNKKWYIKLAWWFTPIIPALRQLRQKDHKLEAKLGYIARLSLKNQNNRKSTKPKMW